jgi:predicted N-acyltransferase
VPFQVKVVQSLAPVPAASWDSCAFSTAQGDDDPYNPFVSHAFLLALEDSGCVGREAGWQPAHVLVEDEAGQLLAAAP